MLLVLLGRDADSAAVAMINEPLDAPGRASGCGGNQGAALSPA